MILTALKHFIYECCIEVFFYRLILNFSDIKPEDYPRFSKYALPLIRRSFPSLFANKVVSVQALPEPTGIYHAMRKLYGND